MGAFISVGLGWPLTLRLLFFEMHEIQIYRRVVENKRTGDYRHCDYLTGRTHE